MELFKIFGTIAIDNSGANQGIDETTNKAQKAHPKISAAFEKIGTAAVKVGKVVASGLAVGAAAIGALAKQSLDSYADYEQLVGGVETLFGSGGKNIEEYAESVGKTVAEIRSEFNKLMLSEQMVLDNAAVAYKSAGLSANEYMETVTSFSASLLQSLGGDTVAACNYADMAVIDMADNANKMGTSISMIQNAYQGFAKQNYTMLDNLKLGYGGTQAEMYRLMQDAEKLGAIFNSEFYLTEKGQLVADFADITTAIHVIQTEMGITGTTAKEASSTIQGSIASTKAAWQNLLVGFADGNQDLKVLMDNLVNSATTAARNIVPRITQILSGITTALPGILAVVTSELPALMGSLLPGLIDGAFALITGLAQMLPEIIMVLINALPGVIGQIKASLFDLFPQLQEPFENLKTWMSDMWSHIQTEFAPVLEILRGAFDKISAAVQPVIDKITEYINSGNAGRDATNFLKDAISFLSDAIQTAIEWLGKIKTWIVENQTAIETIGIVVGAFAAAWVLVNGAITIWNAIGAVATAITTGFGAAVAFLTSPIGLVVAAIGLLIGIIVLCVKHWDEIKQAASNAWEWIKGVWEKVADWFNTSVVLPVKNFFVNLWTGITNAATSAWDFIKGVWQTVTSWFSEHIIQPISNLFSNMWNSIVNAAKGAINGILSGLESFINGAIGLVNKLIGGINKVTGAIGLGEIGLVTEVSLPKLAKGGVLEKGQVGLLEGQGAEAVVPLDRNQAWISAVAKDMQGAIGGAGTTKLLEQILDALQSMDNGMKDKMTDAFASMKFDVNNREFARMVKAVN